jgi:hypothetical protein
VVFSGMRFLSLLRVCDWVVGPGPEMLCLEGLTVSASPSGVRFRVYFLTRYKPSSGHRRMMVVERSGGKA